MKKHSILTLTSALILGLSLSACQIEENDNKDLDPTDDASSLFKEITVDASSDSQWVYLDLDTHATVAKTDGWEIALQRYHIMVPNDSDVALVAAQSEFYDNGNVVANTFINATADGELDHLTAVFDSTTVTFSEPGTSLIMDAEGIMFYDYNSTNHALYANDDAVWVIRSSTGNAYAKLRPTKLFDDAADSGSGAYEEATFELFIQSSTETEFSSTATTWAIATPGGVGHECYDIDTNTEVACSSDDWDIQFKFNYSAFQAEILLNGGISGDGNAAAVDTGAYSAADTAELVSGLQDNADDAFDITQYNYKKDLQSFFLEFPWHAYDVNSNHDIWSNFRVYGVKTDTDTYLIQFTNYYNALAESGHVTLRYLTVE